jgi:hypothetical protein
MKSAIEAHLSANRETIRLLREAASRERCRYPIDQEEGITAELPPLGNMRASTSLLSLATCLNAREGRADAAGKTLEAAFALADSFAQIPNMICQLVRMAAQSIALDGLEHALNCAAVPDSHLVRLQSLLRESASRTQALERGLVGETVTMFYAIRRLDEIRPGQLAWAMRIKKTAALTETDAVYYLDVMEQYLAAQQKPFPRRIEICRRVDSSVGKAFDRRLWRWIHPFAAYILPTGVHHMVLREAETTARMHLGLVALAIERFRIDKGRLPANLLALVPTYIDEVPADPFDGQAVRYRIEPPGYLLYRIGRNEADDGGTETEDEETGDIVFRVRR